MEETEKSDSVLLLPCGIMDIRASSSPLRELEQGEQWLLALILICVSILNIAYTLSSHTAFFEHGSLRDIIHVCKLFILSLDCAGLEQSLHFMYIKRSR